MVSQKPVTSGVLMPGLLASGMKFQGIRKPRTVITSTQEP